MLESMIASLPGDPVRFAVASVLLIAGLASLIYGSDWLVRGAAQLARRLGVAPFAIGVTVVAFGTSAPELFASVGAVFDGYGELGVGNVVGSNIANICLILGFTAMIRPITIPGGVLKMDVPVMVAVTLIGAFVLLDGFQFQTGLVSRLEGLVLFAGIIIYVAWQYHAATKEAGLTQAAKEAAKELEQDFGIRPEDDPKSIKVLPQIALVLVGLVALSLGAKLLVTGGVTIATILKVPEVVIGLTVVAFGTSVPELAASIRAMLAKESAIAVGNILGSNVFNLLCVLGMTGLLAPAPILVPHETIIRDVPAMVVSAFACWLVMGTGLVISRLQGTVLFLGYVGYIALTFVWGA